MAIWRDRVTGQSISDAPHADVPGRWALLSSGIPVRMNAQALPEHMPMFLVPDRRDNWAVSEVERQREANGRFGAGLLPDMTDVRALRQIAVPIRQSKTLAALADVTPLPADLDDRVKFQRIDKEIDRQLPHVMHVCHRPRQQLKVDLEKLPVGRAKRIPPRSIEYLTAHSEDWKRRTAGSIEPAHVIAEIIEDQIDIYENRVSAELVDRIVRYLGDRAAELEKMFALLNDEHDFRLALQVGNHYQLANRISSLWGSVFVDEGISKVAAETRVRVGQMRQLTLGLKKTRLYKGVPGRRAIKRELHHTNILENDPHYREIAALWRAWHEYGAPREESDDEVFTHWQDANLDFSEFCRLLVIRAVVDIGWNLQDPNSPAGSPHIALIGPTGNPAALAVDEYGVFTITDEFASKLRIVPVLASLARTADVAQLSSWLDSLEEQAVQVDTLVLFLGRSRELDQVGAEVPALAARLEALTAPPRGNNRVRWFVPVSPFEITSIEKVGRSLNAWLRGKLLRAYPPQVKCPKNLVSFLDVDGLVTSRSSDEWSLTTPIDQKHLDAFSAKLSSLTRPEVRRQVGHVSDNAISRVSRDFQDARKRYDGILCCPVCGQRSDNFLARGGNAYVCTCISRSCDSEWGIRVCGACREAYPYILPDRSTVQRNGSANYGWLDRLFGRDCIAIPCARPSAPGGFVCPNCSKCSARPVVGECDDCPASDDLGLR